MTNHCAKACPALIPQHKVFSVLFHHRDAAGLIYCWRPSGGNLCDFDTAIMIKLVLDPYKFCGDVYKQGCWRLRWCHLGGRRVQWELMMPLDHKATQRGKKIACANLTKTIWKAFYCTFAFSFFVSMLCPWQGFNASVLIKVTAALNKERDPRQPHEWTLYSIPNRQ